MSKWLIAIFHQHVACLFIAHSSPIKQRAGNATLRIITCFRRFEDKKNICTQIGVLWLKSDSILND